MKYLWLILILFMAGCASYSENRNTELHANEGSTVYLIVEGVQVDTQRRTGQEADADLKAALSQMGGTAVASGAEAVLREILNKWKVETKDSNNQKTVTPVVKPFIKPLVVKPEKPTSEPVKPDDMHGYTDSITIFNQCKKVSVDGILQDKFIFPRVGPDYGSKLLFIWSDGNRLFVHDSKHMKMKSAPDARKYQPGHPYSSNASIKTAEVYAKRGTHPEAVTIFYNEIE